MPSAPDNAVAALAPGGRLARRLPGYESREPQLRMARAVAATFENGGVLVVEAGTGTGKSLAYLVPAIHWAKRHDERVIVSTRTINLQEQLLHSDLPFLRRNLGVDFTAALVKGRTNYLCLRKANELRAEPDLFGDDTSRPDLRVLLQWAEETDDGSLADLGFLPRPDSWELVRVEHDDCLRTRCPEYDRCFFYRARRAAAEADVLIVNHSLLLADRALRAALHSDETAGILPPASRLVIDEAHHLEDVSTDYFGGRVTLRGIERTLGRLQGMANPAHGVLPALLQKLLAVTAAEDRPAAEGAASWLDDRLRPGVEECRSETEQTFDTLRLALFTELRDRPPSAGGSSEEATLRVTPGLRETPFWEHVVSRIMPLADRLEAFAAATRPVLERTADVSESTAASILFLAHQLEAQATRLAAVAAELRAFLEDDPAFCHWFSVRASAGGEPAIAICSAPVEVGAQLRETLFGPFESVVLTSATLTVGKRFDYLFERSGLAGMPDGRVDTIRLPSPFDYGGQALLAIPEDLPEPDRPGHEAALHRTIDRALRASAGGAFVLFTSYAALKRAVDALSEPLADAGIDLLRQGESDRHTLLERFRRNRTAALFATDSFWEGVDVRGEGLRSVLIARLPFRVPTEPVQQSRTEAIEARGGNPFVDYGLPQAVIRLRQGFGRLIRSRDDTGVVWILDSRIVRRRYGEVFLDSLPPARVITGPTDVVARQVEGFFGSIVR